MTITAQEYLARIGEPLSELGRELLATLRYHEANAPDASLGELLRRIREHPKNRDRPYPIRPFGCDSVFSIDAAGLTAFLAHLDSLLPKEPEVVTGASGNRYSMVGGQLWIDWVRDGFRTMGAKSIPVEDAPVVAKLMAKGGKDV